MGMIFYDADKEAINAIKASQTQVYKQYISLLNSTNISSQQLIDAKKEIFNFIYELIYTKVHMPIKAAPLHELLCKILYYPLKNAVNSSTTEKVLFETDLLDSVTYVLFQFSDNSIPLKLVREFADYMKETDMSAIIKLYLLRACPEYKNELHLSPDELDVRELYLCITTGYLSAGTGMKYLRMLEEVDIEDNKKKEGDESIGNLPSSVAEAINMLRCDKYYIQ